MPRKSAAVPAAAKGAARAKAAPAKTVKAPAKVRAVPAKSPQVKSTRPGVKAAVKAAAKSLAAPAPKRSPRKAPAVPAAVRDTAPAARPVLVRDSFTMPEQEYAVLAEVKQACLRAGIEVKKSELLRIGVALLGQVDVATLKSVLAALPQLKTGRPPTAP